MTSASSTSGSTSASTRAGGNTYSFVYSSLLRIERHGRSVVVFWIDGLHDQVGWNGEPAWDDTPIWDDLRRPADRARDDILHCLGDLGLI